MRMPWTKRRQTAPGGPATVSGLLRTDEVRGLLLAAADRADGLRGVVLVGVTQGEGVRVDMAGVSRYELVGLLTAILDGGVDFED